MKAFRAWCFSLGIAAIASVLVPAARAGVTATFTFDSDPITATTPLNNIAPESGPATFNATFTSSPGAGDFEITTLQPNQLFSNNSLVEVNGPIDTLTISFSQAIDSVSLDFSTSTFGGGPALNFNSSAGSTSAASTPQSDFDGGVLTFNSATSFTSFTLDDSGLAAFAIDNLTVDIASATSGGGSSVPLPSGLIGFSVMLAGLRLWKLRVCFSARAY
jgi:hypothetical protein